MNKDLIPTEIHKPLIESYMSFGHFDFKGEKDEEVNRLRFELMQLKA